jgi:hypothetical protein
MVTMVGILALMMTMIITRIMIYGNNDNDDADNGPGFEDNADVNDGEEVHNADCTSFSGVCRVAVSKECQQCQQCQKSVRSVPEQCQL